MKYLVHFLLAAVLLLSCQRPSQPTDEQPSDAEDIEQTQLPTDSVKAKPMLTRPDTTLLDIFYGQARYPASKTTGPYYTGIDTVLDRIPGLLKWQRFSYWYSPSSYGKNSRFPASLCVYFDSLYPNAEVMRRVAVKADSIFRDLFVGYLTDMNSNGDIPAPDTTVRLCPSEYNTPSDVLRYFEQRFAVADTICKASPNARDAGPDFRVTIVACRQYHDDEHTTYLVEGSFDWNATNGCPSYALYFTYDNTGKQLKYDDIFQPDTKREVMKLLKKVYRKECRPGYGDYQWSTKDVGDNLALVKEGVLFYYEPYSIGCGAEGQYNLILKYEDVAPLLKTPEDSLSQISQITDRSRALGNNT